MTKEELIKNILNIPSESRTLEFKRLGSRNESIDRILQSIVAMANTDGGTLILGVEDPQKTTLRGLDRILGIEENLEFYDEIGKTVRKISPPISSIWPPDLVEVLNKNVRIGLLAVPKISDGFRSIEGHVYVRLERGNKRLLPQEVVHFAYVKGFERADRELVSVDFSLLKTNFYDVWRRKRGITEDSIDTVLEKTGLARKGKGGQMLPTRAAVLLFAEFPNDLLDTKCAIRVFQYEGNLETIKETITNAVIHRDYYTKRDIEIRIFEDRVEIESPGLIPLNITPSNIGVERAHGYRNDLLVKHLREFPDPPNLDQNEGVKAMRQTMRTANLYPPIFWTYPRLQDAVRVIFFNG